MQQQPGWADCEWVKPLERTLVTVARHSHEARRAFVVKECRNRDQRTMGMRVEYNYPPFWCERPLPTY